MTDNPKGKSAQDAAPSEMGIAWECGPMPSVVVTLDGKEVASNAAARKIFGARLGLTTRPAFSALGRDQVLLVQGAMKEASTGTPQILQRTHLQLETGEIHADIHVSSLGSTPSHFLITFVDRTDEERLAENHANLRTLADHAAELMYLVDSAGKIVYLNKAVADVLPGNAEQAEGKFREELMPQEAATQHALTDQIVLQSNAPLVRSEYLTIGDETHIFESHKFPINSSGNNLPLIGGISRDVTRERRFNENVRFSEAIFHNARDAIALTKIDGTAQRVNRSFENLTGFSNSTIKGLPLRILGETGSQHQSLDLAMSIAAKSGFWSGQLEFRNADGSRSVAWARITLLRDDDHQPEGLMWIITDISELRTAQDMRLAAERESQAKNEFLAMMSHELRTPLGGILGSMELVMDEAGDLPPKVLDSLRNVRSAGETLLQIVNDLLDMSRLQAGKVHLELHRFSLSHLLKQVCAINQASAEVKGITLELSPFRGSQTAYIGDRHRLTQIFHNLIGNAVKFNPSGGSIKIQVAQLDPLTVTVSDTGIGMTEDETERIFEPFEQADNTISRRFGGTGLGLTIVRSLVELMSGSIRVESTAGKGTSVTVTLPLELSQTDAKDQEAAKGELDRDTLKSALQGLKILVADDNMINRTILTTFLEGSGAAITSAEDGNEAVDKFVAAPTDILCLDISMPGKDGISALKDVRQHCAQLGLTMPKSIAVTANAMPQQQREYLELGFDACVSKPFRRQDVVRLIKDLALQREKADKAR